MKNEQEERQQIIDLAESGAKSVDRTPSEKIQATELHN